MYYKKIDKELPQKESNPPSNTLAITPFVYQKLALHWMLGREGIM
jgi:hypothetical protein